MVVNKSVYLTVVAWGCRALLGMVFLFAAFPKLLAPKAFADIIDAYGIVPETALIPVALGLSILEVVVGAGIFFKRTGRPSLVIIFILLLVFIGVLGYGIWLGLDIDCGCFGENDPHHLFFSGLRVALYRDVCLLLPVAYLYWHGRPNHNLIKEMRNDGKTRDV